jgi:hypothetical protein
MTDFRALCAELLEALECEPSVQSDDWSVLRANARTALAQPEPQEPTDEELKQMFHANDTLSKHCEAGTDWSEPLLMKYEFPAVARAVLARWGCPAIEAMPVSERLPGPEDCDEEGCCWWWRTDGVEEHWELTSLGDPIRHNESCAPHVSYTHWLPYTAIPTPTREENFND